MNDDIIIDAEDREEYFIPTTDDMEFIEYYSRHQSMLLAEIKILEQQHERRVKAIQTKIKTLEYFNGTRADNVARKIISMQKKKSFDTPYGRFSVRDTAGYVKARDGQQFIEGLATFKEDHDELLDAIIEYKAVVDTKMLKARFRTQNGRVYLEGEELTQNQINALGLDIIESKSTLSFNVPKDE